MRRMAYTVLLTLLCAPLLATAETPEHLYDKAMAALSGAGPGTNQEDARRYMQQSAESGYVPAQVAMGYFYEMGVTTASEPGEALNWYKKAAANGDTLAQYLVGRMYAIGSGTSMDNREAEKWLTPAASSGNPFAAYFLGMVEEQLDYKKAPEWYRKAAEAGLPQAQKRYGNLLREGRGVPVDKFNAYIWLLLAYEAGQHDVVTQLSLLEGDLGPSRTEEAKFKAHDMQTSVSRAVSARGCTGWDGEFEEVPTPPPIDIQRFCR